ncbi:recombinase family protein [Nordella sp. HKS 07]|nr:recombinase family protein [Nordella sp. HKS 07]QIG52441.1 recombinase family protein [Nordella sp. HKS 07]
MKPSKTVCCAIYTRVSTDQGLEQEFNSLDAQREASEAYIKSQAHEGWTCLKDQYDDGGFSGGSMDRPALLRLLEDVRQKKLDVIVVYKVDRLTRSLADFAKLVELFDANDVSFVSVTQSFNTTSSMGRLTLNVLLSFAQFEREVTGERIRDKIAASKKKGLWMGGVVPYGYRVERRKLIVDEAEAKDVRLIFQMYSELKSIPALIRELDEQGVRSRIRKLVSGKEIGGIPFTTGPLSHMLGNRVYLGEINHRGKSYPGEHEPILSQALFDAVQAVRAESDTIKRNGYERSGAMLTGLIYDAKGNRMTPVYAKKGTLHYRYYQSAVLAQGLKSKAGSICRVPAAEIERAVAQGVLDHGADTHIDDGTDAMTQVRERIRRIEVMPGVLKVTTSAAQADQSEASDNILTIPWSKPSNARKREILGSSSDDASRPIRSEARSRLLKAVARGHRWLSQLMEGQVEGIKSLANTHKISEKSIRSTLTLASLAPDIVEAAIAGRLPRNIGISQMIDPPLDWSQQKQQLNLS